MIGYIFHRNHANDQPIIPLTPEELKAQEKVDVALGGLMFVTSILILGFIVWALTTA
jgi:hypothetical protein